MNSKKIGNLTELQCATYLYSIGCAVSIPFGNSEKYDLIIDWKDHLYKVQVKHANLHYTDNNELDFLSFKCCWQGHNQNGYSMHKYKVNEVDYFATFYNGKCYLIPQSECSNGKTLRNLPPKNGQKKGISFLSDYEAKEVLNLR